MIDAVGGPESPASVAEVGGNVWRERIVILLATWLFLEIGNFLFWELAPDVLLINTGALRSLEPDEAVLLRVIALMPILFLPTRIALPSQMAVWILYICVYTSTVMFGRSIGIDSLMEFLPLLSLMTVSLFLLSRLGSLPRTTPVSDFAPAGTSRLIIAIWVIAALTLAIYVTGSVFFLRSLEDLYDTRDEFIYLARTAGAGVILAYLAPPVGSVLAPLVIAWGVISKRYLYVVLALAAAAIGAAQWSDKASLLGTIVSGAAAWSMSVSTRSKGRIRPEYILLALSGAGIAAYVADVLLGFDQGSWDITQLLYFRVHAVPGIICSLFYDFFSVNPPAHWSYATGSGPLSWLIGSEPIYEMQPARLIGQTYFWGAETNANANLWFNGYAEAGLFGTVFESTLLIGYFFVLDRVAIAKSVPIVTAATASIGFCLSNGGMPTALVTNGLALFVLLLLLTRRNEFDERARKEHSTFNDSQAVEGDHAVGKP